jgi:hypothetical protein
MTARLFAAALAVALLPVATRAAEDENPYKNAKVGDYSTYKMTMKVAGQNLTGTVTMTVTDKTDKEVTVETTGKVNGMDIPAQKQKIDLTKPFDPTKVGGAGGLPPGVEAKVEKGKEGKEKLKVAGKEYECVWTTFKVKAKAMGVDIDADSKVWTSKDIAMGMAKMETNMTFAGMKIEMTMELSETGSKK